MVATIVEVITGGGINSTATLTTTPQPGDIIAVLSTASGQDGATFSGCGATWTLEGTLLADQSTNLLATQQLWVGRSASFAGTISATIGASRSRWFAFLIRGTNGAVAHFDRTVQISDAPAGSTSTAVVSGPTQQAGDGQAVVAIGDMYTYQSSALWPYSTNPPDGWTTAGPVDSGSSVSGRRSWRAHRASGSTVDHRVTGQFTWSSGSGVYIAQAVLGGGGSAPLAVGARVGLTFEATTGNEHVTTLTTGARAGLALGASSTSPTALATGAQVGLDFAASPVVATTLTTPAHVRLTFHSRRPSGWPSETTLTPLAETRTLTALPQTRALNPLAEHRTLEAIP